MFGDKISILMSSLPTISSFSSYFNKSDKSQKNTLPGGQHIAKESEREKFGLSHNDIKTIALYTFGALTAGTASYLSWPYLTSSVPVNVPVVNPLNNTNTGNITLPSNNYADNVVPAGIALFSLAAIGGLYLLVTKKPSHADSEDQYTIRHSSDLDMKGKESPKFNNALYEQRISAAKDRLSTALEEEKGKEEQARHHKDLIRLYRNQILDLFIAGFSLDEIHLSNGGEDNEESPLTKAIRDFEDELSIYSTFLDGIVPKDDFCNLTTYYVLENANLSRIRSEVIKNGKPEGLDKKFEEVLRVIRAKLSMSGVDSTNANFKGSGVASKTPSPAILATLAASSSTDGAMHGRDQTNINIADEEGSKPGSSSGQLQITND